MGENTKKLAAFVASASYDDLPANIIHETKRVLLDSLGCAIAGLSMQSGAIVVELARRLGGPNEASIIGTVDKVASTNAAFTNAQLINAQDFDAGSVGHDTPAVIAEALAMAETTGSSGKDLLLFVALGHELVTRLDLAQGLDVPEGWAFVTPAIAAIGSRALHLSQEQIQNAIGISSFIHPPNTLRRHSNAPSERMTKYTVFGQIVQAGVTSALLAQMGFTGNDEVLDTEGCFWKTTGNRTWEADRLSEGLGEKWTQKINYKRYPSNFSTAAAKDCFIDVIGENKIQPEEIEKITAKVWLMVRTMNKLETELDFTFNVPYQLTCAAHWIDPTRWLDPAVRNDPKLQAFMQRVKFDIGCNDKEVADPSTNLSSAEVTARGKTFKKEALHYKGQSEPEEYRITDGELIEKFKGNVSKVLSQDSASKVVKGVFELEELVNITEFTKMLSP